MHPPFTSCIISVCLVLAAAEAPVLDGRTTMNIADDRGKPSRVRVWYAGSLGLMVCCRVMNWKSTDHSIGLTRKKPLPDGPFRCQRSASNAMAFAETKNNLRCSSELVRRTLDQLNYGLSTAHQTELPPHAYTVLLPCQ